MAEFYEKVVDDEAEGEWFGNVFPETWRVAGLVISVAAKDACELLVCEDAGLR